MSDSDSSSGDGADLRDSRYPLSVLYCGVCGLPPEFCSSNPDAQFKKCLPWLNEHCPEMYGLDGTDEMTEKLQEQKIALDSEKLQKQIKSGNRIKEKLNEVVISVAQRQGKKQVSIIKGLDLFGVKLSDASKLFKKKFSCGSSVVKGADQKDLVEVQGDHREEISELIVKNFDIEKTSVFFEEKKIGKRPAF